MFSDSINNKYSDRKPGADIADILLGGDLIGIVLLFIILIIILNEGFKNLTSSKKTFPNEPFAVMSSGSFSYLGIDLKKKLVFMTPEASQDSESYMRSLPLEVCYFIIVPDYNSSETALATQNSYHTFKIPHTKQLQDGSVWGYCYMLFVSEVWARENLSLSDEEINDLIAVKG